MARTTKLERAYKRYCKARYYVVLAVDIYEYLVKLWLISVATGMLVINIPSWMKWVVASTGITTYLFAKWYQLKQTKFRKNDFYKKKPKKRRSKWKILNRT